jgi:hypothetical protein
MNDGRTVCGRRIAADAIYVESTTIAQALGDADFVRLVNVCGTCNRLRDADTIAPYVLTVVAPC